MPADQGFWLRAPLSGGKGAETPCGHGRPVFSTFGYVLQQSPRRTWARAGKRIGEEHSWWPGGPEAGAGLWQRLNPEGPRQGLHCLLDNGTHRRL